MWMNFIQWKHVDVLLAFRHSIAQSENWRIVSGECSTPFFDVYFIIMLKMTFTFDNCISFFSFLKHWSNIQSQYTNEYSVHTEHEYNVQTVHEYNDERSNELYSFASKSKINLISLIHLWITRFTWFYSIYARFWHFVREKNK